MPGFDTNQWAVLLLVLVLGWLLGLMSRSGASKWRRAYRAEQADHAALRAEHDTRLAAANARIAELERAAPVAGGLGAGIGGGLGNGRTGQCDDLSLIRGVGLSGAARLNDHGVHDYRDISRMSAADEAALESRMGVQPGHIARERWREQADMLAAGRHDDHRHLFS
ncbi:hypothetical protein [Sphingomonas montana]|uniref:hypothetical protein n=1 Tax=Sphingomonas montana TaxID=1843236 RepID=UPI00096C3B1D|nr:hypothetical protein [Sphingomonas montana]